MPGPRQRSCCDLLAIILNTGEHTGSSVAVHGIADSVLIGVVALRVQFSVAILTMATGDREGDYHSITGLDIGCLGAYAVNNAAAFVA